MTLSDLGIQYICENFGDASRCCVKTGLSWYFITPLDERLDETGGTAMIVSRFASGIAKTLTMVSPNRGTFTPEELDAANGSRVFLEDAKEITNHDEPTEVQWCFIPCSDHADQTTCEKYGCHWWNGACHDVAPTCEELNTQVECLDHDCVWYNNSCHSIVTCADINNQTECEAHDCHWWNGACHDVAPTCEELNTQTECQSLELAGIWIEPIISDHSSLT
ncbi:unnamed protein product [marine sediment metagenome]|uniref:Uncharacterized protein n=1 Tax=marine sediment metagenome TaxID=412755 RepID=X1HH07_9ZZZZ